MWMVTHNYVGLCVYRYAVCVVCSHGFVSMHIDIYALMFSCIVLVCACVWACAHASMRVFTQYILTGLRRAGKCPDLSLTSSEHRLCGLEQQGWGKESIGCVWGRKDQG